MFVAAETFGACVMNPPYRKAKNAGSERASLQRIGLRVTNLYAAFLALAAELLEPGGQMSAIVPRSFASGLYFKPFRRFFLERMALDRLHVYEQRGQVFADADVLQENVVLAATRSGQRRHVVLSTSAGYSDQPSLREVPYSHVVQDRDPQQFVHIPVDESDTAIAEQMRSRPSTLKDLDIRVSTGRVVDFASASTSVEIPSRVQCHWCTRTRAGRSDSLAAT